MKRIVFILLACSFSFFPGCGDDSNPSSPLVVSNISTFYGEWSGTLSNLQVTLTSVPDPVREFEVVYCTIQFDRFGYELSLESGYSSELEYRHTQSGTWQWNSDKPGELEFYLQNESVDQVITKDGVKHHTGKSGENYVPWQAKLEFTANFANLKIYEAIADFGYLKFTEQTEFELVNKQ